MKWILATMIFADILLHVLYLTGLMKKTIFRTDRGYNLFWVFYWVVAFIIILKI